MAAKGATAPIVSRDARVAAPGRTGEGPKSMRRSPRCAPTSWLEEGTEGLSGSGHEEMTEIIFEVTEDKADGGYSASALGYGVHTQGHSIEEIGANVKGAVDAMTTDSLVGRRSS